jgi:hypothetical protein
VSPSGESRPRYLPDRPLPPYTFVPGRSPHPVSDPLGHSHGRQPETVPPLDPLHWSQNRNYLRGIDLFNHGYFWESHEEWEGLWHAVGRRGAVADFLKGLIRLAAAGVKHLEGKPVGVASHSRRAAELLRGVAQAAGAGPDCFLGLRLDGLVDLAETIVQRGWPTEAPLLLLFLPAR